MTRISAEWDPETQQTVYRPFTPEEEAQADADAIVWAAIREEEANKPDPQTEFEAAITAIDTTLIVDVKAKEAIDALKSALLGTSGRDGKPVAQRSK